MTLQTSKLNLYTMARLVSCDISGLGAGVSREVSREARAMRATKASGMERSTGWLPIPGEREQVSVRGAGGMVVGVTVVMAGMTVVRAGSGALTTGGPVNPPANTMMTMATRGRMMHML